MDNLKYFYFFFTIISVYIVSMIYSVGNNAGSKVSFRPPSYVFAIVWPILLLLMGYSCTLRPELLVLYFLLTLFIAVWCIVYNYSVEYALGVIIVTVIYTIILIFYKFEEVSSYLLVPLAMWLAFESVLNYYSIILTNKLEQEY